MNPFENDENDTKETSSQVTIWVETNEKKKKIVLQETQTK
jgi:hypothetical protein